MNDEIYIVNKFPGKENIHPYLIVAKTENK